LKIDLNVVGNSSKSKEKIFHKPQPMKKLSQIIALFLLGGFFGCPKASAGVLAFETIDMKALGLGNGSISGIGSVTPGAVPYGSPTVLKGVPFIITQDSGQVWNAYWATGGNGSGDVTVTFPIVANDIYGFYTVANTYWGVAGTFTKYRFDFASDGDVNTQDFYETLLTNGTHLRDFNRFTNVFQNTINGTTTVQVFQDPVEQTQLDRQWIDLQAAGFGGRNLTSFTITDTGGAGESRIFLVAATAQTGAAGMVPEPSALSLIAVGLGGLAMLRRRRA
jgi:hypothetical protein